MKSNKSKRRKMTNYPCGSCHANCYSDSVFCETCTLCFHRSCQDLTVEQMTLLSKNNNSFVCSHCCTSESRYNFQSALDRLKRAASDVNTLKSAVEMEIIFLRKTLLRPRNRSASRHSKIDQRTLQYLMPYNRNCNNLECIPVSVTADGNCLFNALSVSLYGDEASAAELRVRTCIELVLHGNTYSMIPDWVLLSPDLDVACMEAAKDGSYSSAWTLAAAATVFGLSIRSVYPPCNGLLDFGVSALNTTFHPRGAPHTIEVLSTVIVMWSDCASVPGDVWTPNHFVPLVCKSLVLDDEEFWKQSATNFSYFTKTSVVSLSEDDSCMEADNLSSDDRDGLKADATFDSALFENIVRQTSSLIGKGVPHSIFDVAPDISNIESTSYQQHSSAASDNQPSCGNSNQGLFLDTDTLITLLATELTTDPKIPDGVKENVYFTLNKHIEKNGQKSCKKTAIVRDDCGVYNEKTSLKTHYFTCNNGTYTYMEKVRGRYVSGKRRSAVDPQPDENDIITLKRYYTSLKRSPGFKRRVSWLERAPSSLFASSLPGRNVCVEYIGSYPLNISSVHGNSKSSASEYIRTKPEVTLKMKEMTRTMEPRAVYAELNLDNSSSAPRNVKQVRNVKYTVQKDSRASTSRQNPADDLQYVLSTIGKHDFVQGVVQTKNTPPCIILYCEEQMMDIDRLYHKAEPFVIGVDRTFNLGPCYVTLLVFKNTDLKRRETQAPPIFLGPLFLHWDGSYETYHHFFAHLRCKFGFELTATEIKTMVFGSDEERALTKALRECFPTATHTLCTRHIEENVKSYLMKVVGVNDSTKRTAVANIFGANGLLSATDEESFDLKVLELIDKYQFEIPGFVKYFKNIVSSLKEFVFIPVKKNLVPPLWKNNMCESMNHILKLSCNWKTLRIPDLIERLHAVVKVQYADVRKALHGEGNFQLAAESMKFQVPTVTWMQKSEEEKKTFFNKFLSRRSSRSKGNTVTSTDGRLTVPRTSRTARKPGQRSRVKSTRTFTQTGKSGSNLYGK